jgi:hypothetical protein
MAAKLCGPNNFGWKNYDEQFRLSSKPNSTLNFKNDWRPADHQLVCYYKHKLAKIPNLFLPNWLKDYPLFLT